MQLDRGRWIVLIIAVVSIVVWMTVFPLVLTRGPAGAFSGEDGGTLCIVGGESSSDRDLVRFVRRFHYMGIRAEVRTGSEGQLCFVLSLARRLPQATQGVLRKGELRAFVIPFDQSTLFADDSVNRAAGLQRQTDPRLGPEWIATSTAPVHRLLKVRQDKLQGPAFVYCRRSVCTAILTEPEPLFQGRDVMAAFPINTEDDQPALLLRLAPPPLQRITARATGAERKVLQLAFVVDDHIISVADVPAPEADGQVTVPLDPAMPDVTFEAAILAAVLTTGPLEGAWRLERLATDDDGVP